MQNPAPLYADVEKMRELKVITLYLGQSVIKILVYVILAWTNNSKAKQQ